MEKLLLKWRDLLIFCRFLENDLNFFTPPVRTLIVRYILNRQIVKPYANDEPIQLERLINDDVYIAAYPLHDVSSCGKKNCVSGVAKFFFSKF